MAEQGKKSHERIIGTKQRAGLDYSQNDDVARDGCARTARLVQRTES
jgi:hypothetical protein